MSLLDNLRKAEQKGSQAVRRGLERARGEWEDVERRIRQRMRIYPPKPKNMAAVSKEVEDIEPGVPDLAPLKVGKDAPARVDPPHPIVSVHGRDVDVTEDREDKVVDPAA